MDWADHHKTIIVLNGGNSANLMKIDTAINMSTLSDSYPHCAFHEDEESLNLALTAVGIVLPERIYESAAIIRRVSSMERSVMEAKDGDTSVITFLDRATGDAVERSFGPEREPEFPIRVMKKDPLTLEVSMEEITKDEYDIIELINSCPLAN